MEKGRIILIRHAESQEDVNPNLNSLVADADISITSNGKKQVEHTSKKVSKIISDTCNLEIYCSPSNRVMQTANLIKVMLNLKIQIKIDSRIRNLNWGSVNLENIRDIEQERYRIGVLKYNFPGGDSTSQFISEIEDFIEEVLKYQSMSLKNIVIITHGFAFRIIAKVLLNMSDDDFRWIKNPSNCHVSCFTIHSDGLIVIDKPLEKRIPIV